MGWITQGTIRSVENSGTAGDAKFQISPSQDYCVKHKDTQYTIFWDSAKNRAVKTDTPFTCGKDLLPFLLHADSKRCLVEFEVDFPSKNKKTPPPTTLTALKILNQ